MLQRIQTIFLALVCLSSIMLLFTLIWTNQANESTIVLDAFSLKQTGIVSVKQHTFYIAIIAIMIAILSIISILKYNNRLLQLKIGIANTFLIISVLLIILYFTTEGSKLINTNNKGTYLIGFYMPIIGLITNFVASKLIKKDEEMVRSAYRMR